MFRVSVTGMLILASSVWISGCSSAVQPSSSPTPAAGSPSASPSVSPSAGTASSYGLTKGQIDVSEVPTPLTATTGTISTSESDGGELEINAQGIGKRGQVVWALNVSVTSQGRASQGTLVAAGRTWNVTQGTGKIAIDRQLTAFSMVTPSAITLTGSDTPKVNTPMVVNLVGVASAAQGGATAR